MNNATSTNLGDVTLAAHVILHALPKRGERALAPDGGHAAWEQAGNAARARVGARCVAEVGLELVRPILHGQNHAIFLARPAFSIYRLRRLQRAWKRWE